MSISAQRPLYCRYNSASQACCRFGTALSRVLVLVEVQMAAISGRRVRLLAISLHAMAWVLDSQAPSRGLETAEPLSNVNLFTIETWQHYIGFDHSCIKNLH
eukprot:scaffold291680_cov22-Prasinocladus_malaysianus.AAC.1